MELAYGTAIQQNYASYTYTTNGQRYSVTDANGNRAEMRYDGHDRQTHWYFPSKTSVGQINTADYEQYVYDAAGNRTSLRKRDGLWLGYQYDALNRLIRKTVPERSGLSSTHTRDVFYGYDVGDRQLYARFDSHSGEGVSNTYDSLGRLTTTQLTMDGVVRPLSLTYDAVGRRTQMAWQGNTYTSFTYDAANRMLGIYEGALGSTNALWTYSYSDYGRRVRRTARHGQYGEAQADSLGRMTSLTTEMPNATHDNVTSFIYNPASQVGSRTISNNAFAWTAHVDVDRSYAVNGLNQYTTAGPAAFTYDSNGNLTGDGSSTYVYDVENRLISSSGATTAQLRYDPLGRLYEVNGSSGITRFFYDGDQLTAEYNATGSLIRRYVHGAGLDDPLVWYEGSGFSDPRWLIADHQGSIVAVSQSSTVLGSNSYDPYGIPAATNVGRFQYTGQAWIPELGMYHYKARIYSPTLGRFLQTDPVGYQDQMNLYAYVGNDPVNTIDPTGENGVLTVYSNYDHAWIAYQADGEDSPTSYGRWMRGWGSGEQGVQVNTERRGNYRYVAMRQTRINGRQERALMAHISTEMKDGSWEFWDNCVHFAQAAWTVATGEAFRDTWGIEEPVDMIEEIRRLNGGNDESEKRAVRPYPYPNFGSSETSNKEQDQRPPTRMGIDGDFVSGNRCTGRTDCDMTETGK